MAGHNAHLAGTVAYLAAHTVCVADGDIEECALAGGLIVSDGAFHHMPQIVELVTQVFLLHPTSVTCPGVRMLWVLSARGVEVAVRFLSFADDGDDGVQILF